MIALAVLAFGVAFGDVEAAVVVDLRAAIGEPAAPVFALTLVTDPALKGSSVAAGTIDPTWWPAFFLAGLAVALAAAVHALRAGRSATASAA